MCLYFFDKSAIALKTLLVDFGLYASRNQGPPNHEATLRLASSIE